VIPEAKIFASNIRVPTTVVSDKMASQNTRGQALFYCALLALQFGLQPMIASRFTGAGVSRASVVIGTELGKIIIAFISIMTEPAAARSKVLEQWSLLDSIKIAALPATLYAIQNLFVQYGYVLLDSMTFNLLNQTKVFSRASGIMRRQSNLMFVHQCDNFRRFRRPSGCGQ
jgi:hypothetical protein